MKLVYFSSGPRQQVFQALLEAGHDIVKVVTTSPERWPKIQPTLALAQNAGIPVTVIERKAQLESLLPLPKDAVGLSLGFGFIFPETFLQGCPNLMLNVHGTLLPKYRGGRTLNWVIENGDTESGVTVHRIDAGVDTGPILVQRAFPLTLFDTGKSLYRKTLAFEPEVVLEALALLENGKAAYTPQRQLDLPDYPDRTPAHSQVDPSRTLSQLYNQIRAADPEHYPAHFYVEGQQVCIKLWRPDKPTKESDLI